METILANIDVIIENILSSLGIWGALISCLLITVESILPILPVCVFIALVFYTFGPILGFIISWIFTCLGCYLSFKLFRSKIKNWFLKKMLKGKAKKKVESFLKYVNSVSVSSLATLVAIPFTPASVINVAAGLSDISTKKFMTSMFIGKIFMVYFWGYIGTTFIECLTHPIYLVRIVFMLVLAFVISKIIGKKFNLD